MKRSEAKLEIFHILEMKYSHPEANAKTAEEILSALEKAGMQPPNTTLDKLVPGGLQTTGSTQYYACWESEDEEK